MAEPDIAQQMRDFVAFTRALAEHDHRFGIGAQLGALMFGVIEDQILEADERAQVQAERVPFADRRSFDLECIGLEHSDTASEVGLADPRAFAEFLRAAAAAPPVPGFDTAAATFVHARLSELADTFRNDDQVSVNTYWQLLDVANAALHFDGELATHGARLMELATHGLQDTGSAYVQAQDAGLFVEPGPQSFGLFNLHRDATASTIDGRWSRAFAAIDACPDSRYGHTLRAELIDRAIDLYAYAETDRITEHDTYGATYSSEQLSEHNAVYAEIGTRLAGLSDGPRRSEERGL